MQSDPQQNSYRCGETEHNPYKYLSCQQSWWLSRPISGGDISCDTEQLSWLVVESFFMSCSVSCWMASLIDNLYLLDLIVLVINWQHVSILRGTIRGDPQEILCRVRSPILFVRSVILTCNHNEPERSVWVNGPSSGKEQQCGSHAKLSGTSRHTYMCAESAQGHETENW